MAVDMRCPVDDRRMFGKVSSDNPDDVRLEFACRDCRKAKGLKLVIHVFDGHGNCIQTRDYG